MTTQTKTLTILGLAALAVGLFGTARPAAAAGLTHTAAFTRTAVIADYDDWNSRDRNNGDRDDRRDFQREQQFRRDQILRRQAEFRREQEIRREEERRREEFRREQDRRHDDRRDFRGDDHGWYGDR